MPHSAPITCSGPLPPVFFLTSVTGQQPVPPQVWLPPGLPTSRCSPIHLPTDPHSHSFPQPSHIPTQLTPPQPHTSISPTTTQPHLTASRVQSLPTGLPIPIHPMSPLQCLPVLQSLPSSPPPSQHFPRPPTSKTPFSQSPSYAHLSSALLLLTLSSLPSSSPRRSTVAPKPSTPPPQ